jgi:hypothetical protein
VGRPARAAYGVVRVGCAAMARGGREELERRRGEERRRRVVVWVWQREREREREREAGWLVIFEGQGKAGRAGRAGRVGQGSRGRSSVIPATH